MLEVTKVTKTRSFSDGYKKWEEEREAGTGRGWDETGLWLLLPWRGGEKCCRPPTAASTGPIDAWKRDRQAQLKQPCDMKYTITVTRYVHQMSTAVNTISYTFYFYILLRVPH